jgi:hypothetical protein
MKRVTRTEKWTDEWFLNLKPISKIVFVYLYENCDEAGFMNLSSKFIANTIGIPSPEVVVNVIQKDMRKAVVFDRTGKKLWIKKYLYYQDCLPLEINNKESIKIKMMLEQRMDEFDNDGGIIHILNNIVKGNAKKRKPTKRFKVPSFEEFCAFYKTKGKDVTDAEAQSLFNHYVSVGWVVGKNKPMRDWKAAIGVAYNRKHGDTKYKTKSDRLEKMKNITNKLMEE